MQRPVSLARFIAENPWDIPADRLTRIDRYTRELFEKACHVLADGTVFMSTGDIPAMWLRDSTRQVLPLLSFDFSDEIYDFAARVLQRQAHYVQIDAYANAFNMSANGNFYIKDFADQSPWVFERKFEVDSLAAVLELGVALAEWSGKMEHLDHHFWKAVGRIIEVCSAELHHNVESYSLWRPMEREHDSLTREGIGAEFGPCGLVWSGFRPSDDRCKLPFHIPSNMYLAACLRRLAPLAVAAGQHQLAQQAIELQTTVLGGLRTVFESRGRWVYEVDGLGSAVVEDDPNMPSLLSAPLYEWCAANDAEYLLNREWLLSTNHSNFVDMNGVRGLASEHTPPGYIWPISIAVIGLTALERSEQQACLDLLEATDAGTGSMHESFNPSTPAHFTREWFSWADMMYVQLALAVYRPTQKDRLSR